MVEGEAGYGEEEDDGKRNHREIDVQPAGDDRGPTAQMHAPGDRRRYNLLGRDVAASRELVDDWVAVDGGWVRWVVWR